MRHLIKSEKQLSLFVMVSFCFFLVIFRMIITSSIFYGFLVWNLFLAAVPFILSKILVKSNVGKTKTFAITALWLLFLPNAPYLLTDFLHFQKVSSMPAWFDLLLLASYSYTGILLGLLSLSDMHKVWKNRLHKWIWPTILVCCLLSGIGMYIGRFLRYNSWDIVHQPMNLVLEIPEILTDLYSLGFSLGYGFFFFLTYCLFKSFSNNVL